MKIYFTDTNNIHNIHSIWSMVMHFLNSDEFEQHVDMDHYAYDGLKKCLSIGQSYRPLIPLKTKGDGNCLVHATCMEEYGRDDVGYLKRQELHEFFLQGSPKFKELWKSQEKVWADEWNFTYSESEWNSEWQLMVNLASSEISQSPSALPLRTLETIHV